MIFRIVFKDLILIPAWLPNSYGTSYNLLLSLHFLTEEMGMIVQPQRVLSGCMWGSWGKSAWKERSENSVISRRRDQKTPNFFRLTLWTS